MRTLPGSEYFLPVQLGIGMSGGCEATNLSIGTHLDCETIPGAPFLDFRNAINEVSRRSVIAVFSAVFPELLTFLTAVYKCASDGPLYLSSATANQPPRSFSAREGMQQGDTLGVLLHASALQLAIRATQGQHLQRALSVRFLAYHDHVTLLGPPSDLEVCLSLI